MARSRPYYDPIYDRQVTPAPVIGRRQLPRNEGNVRAQKVKADVKGMMKDQGSKIKALAMQERWRRACIKVTNRGLGPSKKRNVQRIARVVENDVQCDSAVLAILDQLRQRASHEDVVVVCKAMTMIHFIFHDCDDRIAQHLARHQSTLVSFDPTSQLPSSQEAYKPFLTSYVIYLRQWVKMVSLTKFPPRTSEDDDAPVALFFQRASGEQLVQSLPVLLDTVDKLIDVALFGPIRYVPFAVPATRMVLEDLTMVWTGLQCGFNRMDDVLLDVERPLAAALQRVYARFVETGRRVETFSWQARSLGKAMWIPVQVDSSHVSASERGRSLRRGRGMRSWRVEKEELF